jgi:hypothetical protein
MTDLSPPPPLTRSEKTRHFLKQAVLILIIFGVWLFIGMLGYHHFDRCNWVDSFFYAALLIADEGPNYPHRTDEAKIFVGLYSLSNVIIFLSTISVVIAPRIKEGLSFLRLHSEKHNR